MGEENVTTGAYVILVILLLLVFGLVNRIGKLTDTSLEVPKRYPVTAPKPRAVQTSTPTDRFQPRGSSSLPPIQRNKGMPNMCDLSERIDPHNHVALEVRLLKADVHRLQEGNNEMLAKIATRLERLESYLASRSKDNLLPMRIGKVSVNTYGTQGTKYASITEDPSVKELLKEMVNNTAVYVLAPLGHRQPFTEDISLLEKNAATTVAEEPAKAAPAVSNDVIICKVCGKIGRRSDVVSGTWRLAPGAVFGYTCSYECDANLKHRVGGPID